MATIKSTLALEDRMSQTLKATSNALKEATIAAENARQEMQDMTYAYGASSKQAISATMTWTQAQNRVTALTRESERLKIEQEKLAREERQAALEAAFLSKKTEEAGRNAQQAGQGYTIFKNVLANLYTEISMRAGELVMSFPRLADSLVGISTRAKLVNDEFGVAVNLQNEVFKAAERSRGSYMDTFNAVGKLGMLASSAFSDPTEIVRFTELLNKSFKISGAGAQEQSAAMYQLTQAMASGRLQGDEFRSIIENAPMLAQSIASYMGVSMGKLREISSEGVITADVIKNAMFNVADDVNAKFDQMPVTFAEAMQRLQNHLILKSAPIVQTFSNLINSESFLKAIDLIIIAASALITTLATVGEIVQPIFDFVIDNFETITILFTTFIATVIPGLIALKFQAISTFIIIQIEAVKAALAAAAAWAAAFAPLLIGIGIIAALSAAFNAMGLSFREQAQNIVISLYWIIGVIKNIMIAYQNAWIFVKNITSIFIDGIKLAYLHFFDFVIEKLAILAKGIDIIFKTNTSNALNNLSKISNKLQNDLKGDIKSKITTDLNYKAYQANDYWTNEIKAQKLLSGVSNSLNKATDKSIIDKDLITSTTGGKALKTENQGKIEIKEEDIKLLHDIATRDYMVNYQQLTPQVTLQGLTVNELVDANQVVDMIVDGVASAAESKLQVKA